MKSEELPVKNPAAVALGAAGGKAWWKKLSARERKAKIKNLVKARQQK